MSITYAQKNENAVQTKREKSVSIIDASFQSESLQRKADIANNAAQRAEAPRPNNTGMPDNLKAGIESLSGFSMDDVRVHYNSSKPATVQALAYTQGTDIHVAPGQEKHLPHEAWHVAQQMAGRVSPTTNINGMPVNDNAALEHEADVMGEMAVQKKMVSKTAQRVVLNKIIQRNGDPLKDMLYGERQATIQKDINEVMGVLQLLIVENIGLIQIQLGQKERPQNPLGRCAALYDFFNRNKSLWDIVRGWNPTWNFKNTCGLLLDLGLALRGTFLSKEFAPDIMSATMVGGRDPATHRVNGKSGWAQFMSQNGLLLQCGPSATTGQLLKVLHAMRISFDKIESILTGVIHYWNDGIIERIRGEYHTAAEVWSAYSYYLEYQANKWVPEDEIERIKLARKSKKIPDSEKPVVLEVDYCDFDPFFWPKEKTYVGKKSLEDDSSDENPVVNGFEIVDMGSDENNCLLLSMELGVLSSAIRDDVKEFEKNLILCGDLPKCERTKEGGMLTPQTVFPVLKRMGYGKVVWIFVQGADVPWQCWRSMSRQPDSYHDELPPGEKENPQNVFLFYNGVNHYKKMNPQ